MINTSISKYDHKKRDVLKKIKKEVKKMQIELTPYEMYNIMKNTTINNTKKFMEDLETYKIKFHDILNIIEDYETYFNTEIDLREETNAGNIYIINMLNYAGKTKEFFNTINIFWSYEIKRGTYLIIE